MMALCAALTDGPPFTRIVSLGGHCEPAAQLRRVGMYQFHSPFDWLVTPMTALCDIISDRGERLATEFVTSNDGKSVACRSYGVLYHHEFARDEDGRVMFSVPAMHACRSKLQHKMESFTRMCCGDERVLFIRQSITTHLPWDRARDFSELRAQGSITDVVSVLEQQFASLDFHILLVLLDTDGQVALDGTRVSAVTRSRQAPGGWFISDAD
jgi:hypothetical protein